MKIYFKLLLRFIQFIILLPIHLFMGLLCVVLSPILPAFAIGKEVLPWYLNWFQTPDAPLDGDKGFNKASEHPIIVKLPRYIRRMLWLIRNPAYGFAWTVLAYDPKTLEYVWKGSVTPQNKTDKGWFFIYQPDGHFQFSLRFKSIPSFTFIKWNIEEKVFYFRFGWKIVGLATGGNQERQKFVFTLNPVD